MQLGIQPYDNEGLMRPGRLNCEPSGRILEEVENVYREMPIRLYLALAVAALAAIAFSSKPVSA